MDPFRAIGRSYRMYASGQGRAMRSEFWSVYLFNAVMIPVVSIVLLLGTVFIATTALGHDIDGDGAYTWDELNSVAMITGYVLTAVALLALSIPVYAVWVRRLHDMGQPGWWLLLSFLGLSIVPLIMAFMPSQRHTNAYGPSHYEVFAQQRFAYAQAQASHTHEQVPTQNSRGS